MNKEFLFYIAISINILPVALAYNPIIITAEKIDDTEGMLSSSVMDSGDISRNPNKNIGTLLSIMPNVERAGSIRGSNFEFKIRGLEDSRIVTKIDGSKTNFRAEYKGRNFISPLMLREIDVKRGSNSVLDGGGAIAGSVNLQTKEAEDIAINEEAKAGGELYTSYGTNGNAQNYNGAAFTKSENTSALIMYAFAKNNDYLLPGQGWQVSENKIPYSNNNLNNALLKLKHNFNSNDVLKLTASLFTEKGESTSNPFRIQYAGDPVMRTLTSTRYAGELKISDFNFKAFFEKVKVNEDGIAKPRNDETNFDSYGFEAMGKYLWLSKNTLIYGVEFIKENQDGKREGVGRENLYPTGQSRQEGVYLQNVFREKKFALLLGARQDYYNISSGENKISNSSNILKKAVISYDMFDFLTPYFRYSEGYRTPLIKEAFASGDILTVPSSRPGRPSPFKLNLAPNIDLKPEYSKNYEAGFKLFGENILGMENEVSFTANYFVNDISNYIMQDLNCYITGYVCTISNGFVGTEFTFQYQNLEKVRLEGFEIESKYNSKNYNLAFSYSQTRGRETKNGNKLLQVAPSKFTAMVARKFENGLSFGVQNTSVAHFDEKNFRIYNVPNYKPQTSKDLRLAEFTKGYSIFDLFGAYDYKSNKMKGTLGISINNVFNTEYKEQTSFIPGIGRNISIYGKIAL
jgi:TonB-dependent heme/hemoglobin receptor